jgi:hypothetical protein
MTRDDDLTRVSREVASRLGALGIALDGSERPSELTEIEEAVERFEEAVESRGGDLMMDEPPEGSRPQPDDPHFALPRRHDNETVAAFVERIERATDVVLRHPRRT